MKIARGSKGQTLVETAFVLILLFGILFAITEFARAWFVKNSIRNAARQGARTAAVTANTNFPASPFSCVAGITCPNNDAVINSVCCQPGVPKKNGAAAPQVTLTCRDNTGASLACNSVFNGCEVNVSIRYNDAGFFVLGGGFWPWPKRLDTTSAASMRYE